MIRSTRQRRAIQKAFERASRPLGPKEVHDAAVDEVPGLGIATVYRTIKELVDLGGIVPVDLPGESTRYELSGKHHHHHFRCRSCDRVFEIEACIQNFRADVPAGFRLEDHEIVLYGLCAECAGKGME